MVACDAASLVATAIRAACDAKALRRTVAAVAAAAVSAVLSADTAGAAKQSQTPVPRHAPADNSVGGDVNELVLKLRERRKAKRQRRRQAKAAACRPVAHDKEQHDVVDGACGDLGVAANPPGAVRPTDSVS